MTRASVAALSLAVGTLAFAVAHPRGPSTALATGSQDALLVAAIAAPSNVSYSGVVEVVRMGSRQAEASVYRVEHRAPDLTRRVYTSPAALAGDSVVAKGDLIFSVDARRRRIVESRNDAMDDSTAFDADYALLRKNYRVTRRQSADFDGRQALDLVFFNRYIHRTTMLIRVDATSKIVLEKKEFAPDGALVSELRFEEVRYVPQLPSADFALPKYAVVRDATLAETSETPDRVVSSCGFAARAPHSLPDGFAPVEGSLVELHGVRTVHLLYSDGVRTFSLFENAKASTLDATRFAVTPVRVGGYDAEYAEDGATALLAWSDGSLHYTLVGEVGLVDLTRVAAAVTP